MTNGPLRTGHPAASPATPRQREPTSVGIAYYRSDRELTFYLRALERFRPGRLVVVLGLQEEKELPLANMPTCVRIVLTRRCNEIDSDEVCGFVPDPLEAIVLAMTGLQTKEGLILLFPADWRGDSPDTLIDKACCRLAVLRGGGVNPERE